MSRGASLIKLQHLVQPIARVQGRLILTHDENIHARTHADMASSSSMQRRGPAFHVSVMRPI